MKYFFKYRYGYINIDADYLYLTERGNWTEIAKLKEKERVYKKYNNHKSGSLSYLYIVIALTAVSISMSLDNKILSAVIIAIVMLFFAVISGYFFRYETALRYKIPLSKILSVELVNNKIKIGFLTSTNQPDFEIIEKAEPKAFQILEELQLLKPKIPYQA